MSECLDADAILDIGQALEWKVEEGLSHLTTCADCRAQLETLQRAREGVLKSTPVDPHTLQRISAALHEARRGELHHLRQRTRLREAAEACTAGVTALVIVVADGAPIEGPVTAAVAFLLGAIFMVIGTALARRLPTLGVDEANV